MYEVEIVDVLFGIILAASVPLLTVHYLKGPRFSNQFRQLAILGGIVWLGYSFFSESLIYQMLGVQPADTYTHWASAVRDAQALARGHWPFDGVVLVGNKAYAAYLAFLHLMTGGSVHLAISINAWAAFWGGLVLVRNIGEIFPERPTRSIWFLLALFFPSTVFWCTGNLKEGFMFWAICQITTVLFRPLGLKSLTRMPWALAGIGVSAVLRPHVCVIWLCSVAGVALLHRRQKAIAMVIFVLVLPLAIGSLEKLVGRELESAGDAVAAADRTLRNLADPRQGSNIDFGEGGPVFFVSGFTSVFFRPFPWEVRNVRTLVSAAETWSLTLLIIIGWLRIGSRNRSWLVRLPPVQMAVLACLGFSFIFTYLPNEGLMVRQRVQVVPALLILAVFPYLHTGVVRAQARAVAALRSQKFGPARARAAQWNYRG